MVWVYRFLFEFCFVMGINFIIIGILLLIIAGLVGYLN